MEIEAERIMRQALMTVQSWTNKALEENGIDFCKLNRSETIDIVKSQIIASGLDEVAMAILSLSEQVNSIASSMQDLNK